MTDGYVDGKVREALVASRGSRSVAQQMLMNWAESDDRLLRGLARPFLKAVTAAAVEGAVRRGAGGTARAAAPGGPRLSREALDKVLSRMGDDDAVIPAPGPIHSATIAVDKGETPDGESHAKAMMTLAKAFAAKKLR